MHLDAANPVDVADLALVRLWSLWNMRDGHFDFVCEHSEPSCACMEIYFDA